LGYKVAIVGIGMVGQEMVRAVERSSIPLEGPLRVFARTARTEHIDGRAYQVEEVSEEKFEGIELALFAGSEGVKGASEQYAWKAVEKGALVIDNSSAFRQYPNVPLVVPEVNASAITPEHRFIANPNCSTIQMVIALAPIHREVGIDRIVVSTYQSCSGWGRAAVDQLLQQSSQALAGASPEVDSSIIPRQIAFNVVPQIDAFLPNGYTKEEAKMLNETRKILGDDNIRVSATCVRVPVVRGHAEAVTIQTKKPLSPAEARDLLLAEAERLRGPNGPHLLVVDDPFAQDPTKRYPTPLDAACGWQVWVGRIRQDLALDNGLSMWVVADNLLKGAATNAVQIAEYCHAQGLIKKQ